jgi:hypothetical protein
MTDLEVLKKMLGRVNTTNFSDWALCEEVYGDAVRVMSIGCPNGSGAGVSAMFDDKGALLSFKVYEADGYPCKCGYCAPFLSGSDNCGCDHSPCAHERVDAPVQKVFVPTEFFSKVQPKKGKRVRKPIVKPTKKRSRK